MLNKSIKKHTDHSVILVSMIILLLTFLNLFLDFPFPSEILDNVLVIRYVFVLLLSIVFKL